MTLFGVIWITNGVIFFWDTLYFNGNLHDALENLFCDTLNLNEKNFDLTFSNFVEVIKLTINNHAPIKKLTLRQKRLRATPWVTKGLFISIKKKQKLHNSHYLSPNFY